MLSFFSEKCPKYASVNPCLLSICPSIACELDWMYIMKKVDFQILYFNVYKTNQFAEVTEDMLEQYGPLSVQKLPMTGGCIAIRRTTPWTMTTALKMQSC